MTIARKTGSTAKSSSAAKVASAKMRLLHLQTPGINAAGKKRETDAQSARGAAADKKRGTAEAGQDHPGFKQSEASVLARGFTTFANAVAHFTGRPVTFVLCCLIIAAWAITGPIFHYSDTWQLIINTGTTIITFLMVFLIQNTQNRDGAAVQAKLDELIRAIEGARNHFIGIEHLTEDQLEAIRAVCEQEAVAEIEMPTGKVTVIGPKDKDA